jgi:Integral peroxisomal membrane peroxin
MSLVGELRLRRLYTSTNDDGLELDGLITSFLRNGLPGIFCLGRDLINVDRTDETEHPAMPKDEFTLPTDMSIPHTLPTGENALRVARWRWVDADWKTEIKANETDAEGWVYTDNTWKNPGPAEAFGKYTVHPLARECLIIFAATTKIRSTI